MLTSRDEYRNECRDKNIWNVASSSSVSSGVASSMDWSVDSSMDSSMGFECVVMQSENVVTWFC